MTEGLSKQWFQQSQSSLWLDTFYLQLFFWTNPNCSMFVLFFYLDLLQNDAMVTSQCMHYIFCQGREFKIYHESVLPGMKRERKE